MTSFQQEYDSDDSNYDSEESLCPLCLDELDITDKSFKPCTCGYQMCRFCWHHIKENLNGKCPHCRKIYNPENYTFVPPDPAELEKMKKDKKLKEKEKKGTDGTNRKSLSNIRVIQRNLVYVTNLSLNVAKDELLRKYEYFGQYGKVLKIVVNKHNLYNAESAQGPSVSAYVTYQKREDAARAIHMVNGALLDSRPLRASYGTTKYCTFFLRNMQCTNPDCMYLHDLGDEKDSYTKEEMALGKHLVLPDLPPPPQGWVPPPPGKMVLPSPNYSKPAPSAPYATTDVPPPTLTPPPTILAAPTPVAPKPVWNVQNTVAPARTALDDEWPAPAAALSVSPSPPPVVVTPTPTHKPISTSGTWAKPKTAADNNNASPSTTSYWGNPPTADVPPIADYNAFPPPSSALHITKEDIQPAKAHKKQTGSVDWAKPPSLTSSSATITPSTTIEQEPSMLGKALRDSGQHPVPEKSQSHPTQSQPHPQPQPQAQPTHQQPTSHKRNPSAEPSAPPVAESPSPTVSPASPPATTTPITTSTPAITTTGFSVTPTSNVPTQPTQPQQLPQQQHPQQRHLQQLPQQQHPQQQHPQQQHPQQQHPQQQHPQQQHPQQYQPPQQHSQQPIPQPTQQPQQQQGPNLWGVGLNPWLQPQNQSPLQTSNFAPNQQAPFRQTIVPPSFSGQQAPPSNPPPAQPHHEGPPFDETEGLIGGFDGWSESAMGLVDLLLNDQSYRFNNMARPPPGFQAPPPGAYPPPGPLPGMFDSFGNAPGYPPQPSWKAPPPVEQARPSQSRFLFAQEQPGQYINPPPQPMTPPPPPKGENLSRSQAEDWFRSLLPHANISFDFGTTVKPEPQPPAQPPQHPQPVYNPPPEPSQPQNQQGNWFGNANNIFGNPTWGGPNPGWGMNAQPQQPPYGQPPQQSFNLKKDLFPELPSNKRAPAQAPTKWTPKPNSPPQTPPVPSNQSRSVSQGKTFQDPAILNAGVAYELKKQEENGPSQYRPFAVTNGPPPGLNMNGVPAKNVAPPPGFTPVPTGVFSMEQQSLSDQSRSNKAVASGINPTEQKKSGKNKSKGEDSVINSVTQTNKNEESSSNQPEPSPTIDIPSQPLPEASNVPTLPDDEELKKKKKKDKKKDKKKQEPTPVPLPVQEAPVSVPPRKEPSKEAGVKEAAPAAKKKPTEAPAESPKIEAKSAVKQAPAPVPASQKRKGPNGKANDHESTNGQDPLAATNAEVDALEKELANATKEMQELEAKLLSLKMKNQEFEGFAFV